MFNKITMIDTSIENKDYKIYLDGNKYKFDRKYLKVMNNWRLAFKLLPISSVLVAKLMIEYLFNDDLFRINVFVFIGSILLVYVLLGYLVEFLAFKNFKKYLVEIKENSSIV